LAVVVSAANAALLPWVSMSKTACQTFPALILFTVLLTFALSRGSRAEPGQGSLFRYGVQVELVGLYATVQDSSGKLITSLKQGDFVIYDNGVPQQISQFSSEYTPLSVLILLDTSSSMAGEKLDNARRSLGQFLNHLNRGDEAMLMTFRTRPRVIQRFTTDMRLLKRNLNALEGNGSTALYDAILAGLDFSKNSASRRRALLLISDGINTYGKAELRDTVEQLRRQPVELFAIGIEADSTDDAVESLVTREVLNQLTRSGGGEAFMVSEARQLGRVCNAISERMHKQYAFGYYPPRSTDGAWHDVRIESTRPGLRIVPSKTGYYPSPQARAARP
jgi:Ca-activated chloride channel homolog